MQHSRLYVTAPDPAPTTHDPSAAALAALLAHAGTLRAAGRDEAAVACGPDILRAYHAVEQGRPVDGAQPRSFSEKLFCRMLDMHERGAAPTYTRLADKLRVRVREHVAARLGEGVLTRLLWSGDDAREIPWSRLPRQAVFKCSEGSGKTRVLQAPFDTAAAEALAAAWQADSYYWFRREFQYLHMPRRLLLEEVLDDGHPDGPLDYIFHCFGGVPRLLQVGSRSHTIHRFFTPSWEPVALTYRERYDAPEIPRPQALDALLDAAATLSAGFDFVRVDFYCTQGRVRFGEMTFTPRAGKLRLQPPEWDERLGDWWHYAGLPDA